jgi:hypothetical protein
MFRGSFQHATTTNNLEEQHTSMNFFLTSGQDKKKMLQLCVVQTQILSK